MNIINDWIGLLHVAAATIALVCGAFVLTLDKGTRQHRRTGYVYTASMLVVIVTAFGIYRLFGGFGPFHAFAIMSIVSLTLGMVPMLKKEKTAKAIKMHYSRMYWSVIGLYAAFAAETLVRLPNMPFWTVVILAATMIVAVGGIYFRKHAKRWENKFAAEGSKTRHGALHATNNQVASPQSLNLKR